MARTVLMVPIHLGSDTVPRERNRAVSGELLPSEIEKVTKRPHGPERERNVTAEEMGRAPDNLNRCAHKVLNRDIVLLNLSEPSQIIGFNPFQRASDGDVSVQVDRRIQATMHAWGVENADQMPTLERTLRLIFTTLLELGLSFHQAQHLINFQSGEIREKLVQRLTSPLIRQEWEELLALKPKDWRAEMLSAKNRLFRLLTSETLGETSLSRTTPGIPLPNSPEAECSLSRLQTA